MDLLPSDDQQQIVDTIKDFLRNEAPVDRLREFGAIGNPDARLWPQLGELGFFALGLPEDKGGVGFSAAEEMLAFQQFGYHLVSPVIFGLVLGARIAAFAGDEDLRDELLAGGLKVGLANSRGAAAGPKDYHLLEAEDADWILFVTEAEAGLYPRDAFDGITRVDSTDSVLILERAKLVGSPRVSIPADVDNIHDRALMLIGAYAVGIGEGARDLAVDYAGIREQFGQPIGAFQSIKHICADMAIRSEAALCQASFAALVMDEGSPDTPFHATASKIVACETAVRNAADCIQVHGAFGFTSEANVHHYLKRAHFADMMWGALREQRKRILAFPTPA
ncbi:acyl-CoA dehydrogenase family protein [Croceicoccus sp. BE223]|uniref:acyl-CoA dehydrogenase family protein n=1 Tax=Croceicoccus sp. BE223 TaxID=2817716 RepID=UPI00285B9F8C|nr:acyl-CoA dehydrogenase family protein [Croceicoccus sp. BE223]MDR7103695.1 alkylation response protein AidB-like acyl-CoA dehydrogenase [Croceicoccus sp. BE223]